MHLLSALCRRLTYWSYCPWLTELGFCRSWCVADGGGGARAGGGLHIVRGGGCDGRTSGGCGGVEAASVLAAPCVALGGRAGFVDLARGERERVPFGLHLHRVLCGDTCCGLLLVEALAVGLEGTGREPGTPK